MKKVLGGWHDWNLEKLRGDSRAAPTVATLSGWDHWKLEKPRGGRQGRPYSSNLSVPGTTGALKTHVGKAGQHVQ